MTGPGPPPVPPPLCYRHPDRVASVVCARCDRPICTDCMIEAPVGWQCPECVRQGAKTSRVVRPFAGQGLRAAVGTNPTPAVLVLVAVNVLCFVASGFGKASILDRFGLWPAQVYVNHQWYRFVDSMFLHFNFEHILFNMVSLIIVGPAVELMLGRARFVALYLLAGLGGNVLAYVLGPSNVLGAGASGAIFGVFAAYVVLARRRNVPMGPVPALIVINLVLDFTGLLGNVDWLAHVGGLLVGAAVALAYDAASRLRSAPQVATVTVGASVVTLAVLALLALAIVPGQVGIG
jgi:membrane associated rhomboid family serine protease